MDRAVVVDMGSLALFMAAIVARRGFVELVDQVVGATLVETLRCVRRVGSGDDAKDTVGTAVSSSMGTAPRKWTAEYRA
jgi:hypothetical protein